MSTENHSSKSEQGLVKVVLDLSKDNGPVATESLWAEPAGDCLFRLRNVPFFAYGFSERDIVRVEESDGKLIVTGTEERGGHSTYRIFLPTETTEEKFAGDWEPLEKLGCTYERANRRLVAIDVPPHSDVYTVYAVLEDGERDGLWEFEEGHCGHALRGQKRAYRKSRGGLLGTPKELLAPKERTIAMMSKAPQWLILTGACVFILVLAVSALFEADIRWLHFFQAWMYIVTIVLAFRGNRWGYFIGLSAAGLWNYANLFVTTFFVNGLQELAQWARTGNLVHPDQLIAVPAWFANLLVILGCLWAFLRLPNKSLRDAGTFLATFVLTTGYFALDMALFQPRYLALFPLMLHPHLP